VVEDQPDNRQIIRDMLAPTDYEITEAENGEEAADHLRSNYFPGGAGSGRRAI
jgi:CheY-like chemotaxis protein